jgi:hypothetical protein
MFHLGYPLNYRYTFWPVSSLNSRRYHNSRGRFRHINYFSNETKSKTKNFSNYIDWFSVSFDFFFLYLFLRRLISLKFRTTNDLRLKLLYDYTKTQLNSYSFSGHEKDCIKLPNELNDLLTTPKTVEKQKPNYALQKFWFIICLSWGFKWISKFIWFLKILIPCKHILSIQMNFAIDIADLKYYLMSYFIDWYNHFWIDSYPKFNFEEYKFF